MEDANTLAERIWLFAVFRKVILSPRCYLDLLGLITGINLWKCNEYIEFKYGSVVNVIKNDWRITK